METTSAHLRLLAAPLGNIPDYPQPYRYLAASLGQLGRASEARAALQKARAISPLGFDFYLSSCPPWFRPEDYGNLVNGMRKAGWQG